MAPHRYQGHFESPESNDDGTPEFRGLSFGDFRVRWVTDPRLA